MMRNTVGRGILRPFAEIQRLKVIKFLEALKAGWLLVMMLFVELSILEVQFSQSNSMDAIFTAAQESRARCWAGFMRAHFVLQQ